MLFKNAKIMYVNGALVNITRMKNIIKQHEPKMCKPVQIKSHARDSFFIDVLTVRFQTMP